MPLVTFKFWNTVTFSLSPSTSQFIVTEHKAPWHVPVLVSDSALWHWACLLAFLGVSVLICKLGVDEDPFVFLKIKKKLLCFWLCWVFAAAFGLPLVPVSSGSCGAWASQCCGFSCCGAQALGRWASVVVAHGMWNLPGPGIEPLSPVLAGGFLPTAPLGKSQDPFLIEQQCQGKILFPRGHLLMSVHFG